MCSACADDEADKVAREEARVEEVRRSEANRQDPMSALKLPPPFRIADLTQVSAEITTLSKRVLPELTNRLGALTRLAMASVTVDMLVRHRYPHLLWANLDALPVYCRSQNISWREEDGTITTMASSTYFSARLPHRRQPAERPLRLIGRDQRQVRADDKDDDEEEEVAAAGDSAKRAAPSDGEPVEPAATRRRIAVGLGMLEDLPWDPSLLDLFYL